MKVRTVHLEEDYPILKTWWEKRGFKPPHPMLLNCDGVIAYDEIGWVACAFLYEDKRQTIGMVEWEATNPDCGSALRSLRGLNTVFDFFEEYCAKQGVPVILSWVAANRGDGRLLSRRNWKKCEGDRHELMSFETKLEAVCLR